MSTIFTTGLTLGGSYIVQNLQAQHVDRKEQIDQFRTLADQMDGLVTAFQDSYLAGKPVDSSKAALQKNIQDQYTALERVEPLIPSDDVKLARRYRSQIVAVSMNLNAPPPPAEAKPLMQSIATARDTRIDVNSALQRETQRWF